jgi:hypothetical protein
VLVEIVVNIYVVRVGQGDCLAEGWMGFDDMLEKLPGGGLASFYLKVSVPLYSSKKGDRPLFIPAIQKWGKITSLYGPQTP